MPITTKTLHLVSLGCAKNLVDSEVMLALLEQDGYTVVDDPVDASLILVNTCGFIRPAVEEAVDEILRLAEYKDDSPNTLLVVTGCMVQRYSAELIDELPEVDLFVGIDDFRNIDRLIRQKLDGESVVLDISPSSFIMDSRVPRRVSTPFFRSYLKVTEGCDNRCAYCMIPSIRGNLRSRTTIDLVAEAGQLEQGGVRELSLIAQDLTAYGDDLDNDIDLVHLLSELLKHTSIPWFRLLYLYPSGISDTLLQLIADQPRIVPYLDVPFQHVSSAVLQRMNRRYGYELLDDLITRIRKYVPNCAIRSTMLVGFPGETQEDADMIVQCLKRWQIDHVGVFQYQDEEGSVAATFGEKVDEEVKAARYKNVMEVQAEVSRHRLRLYINTTEPVLIEGVSRESDLLLEGRTRFQAPDIDGCIYITSGKVNPGDIVPVYITDAHIYDLVGEVVSKKESSEKPS